MQAARAGVATARSWPADAGEAGSCLADELGHTWRAARRHFEH